MMTIKIKRGLRITVYTVFLWLLVLLLNQCVEKDEKSQVQSDNGNETEIVEIKPVLDAGMFRVNKVVDGDTIGIDGIKKSVRLLCVDTEETFKKENSPDKKLAYDDFKSYLKIHQSENVIKKYATPFGDETKEFAEEFFAEHPDVRLEHDSLTRLTGFFDRHLCYVVAKKNGKWINFNVELVRNGYSPYYGKYGYSNRYHKDFIRAEKEARKKKIGIWSNKTKRYPDYEKRIAIWNERADAIRQFELLHDNDDSWFMIIDEEDWGRLQNWGNKELTLFGSIDQIRKKGPPYRVFMSHKQGRDILLYTDDEALHKYLCGIYEQEKFIYVTGNLEQTEDGLRIEILSPEQIKEPEN